MYQKEKDIKIEVKVEDEIALGKFANFSNISHSPDEFIFDFLFIHPAPPPGFGKLVSRIVMTPTHAKRFLNAMRQNLQEYENRFGAINLKSPGGEIDNLQ